MKHSHHSHAHVHQHAVADTASLNTVFLVCIGLNLLFVVVEAIIGLLYHSVGLLSDAGHNLSDVCSLILALLAFRMSRHSGNSRFTYGYKKGTVLVSLTNAIILLLAVGAIAIESFYKLSRQDSISGEAISWTAAAGILINGITAWMLMKNQKHDLNVRGAFLHMLMDTLVSAGVVVSGIIISYTGWSGIDALVGIAIAVIILVSTWKLLKESLWLALDAVPDKINANEVAQQISGITGVTGWHHLHIWAVSTTENAATVHVVIDDLQQMDVIKREVRECLRAAGIAHSTIECETSGYPCGSQSCC